MILEVAILDVKEGQKKEFEAAFKQAQSIIRGLLLKNYSNMGSLKMLKVFLSLVVVQGTLLKNY